MSFVNGKKVLTINNTIYMGENINLDATPKGVYENLAALQAAYPNGTDGVYLTSDNGHWYFYQGSWQDGGVYQATASNIGNYINVKDYGAVGDGVTDDTTAITTAINALNNNNNTLYFPNGTYLVSSALTIPSNCTVKGFNANSSILKLADTATATLMLVLGTAENPVKNVEICNLQFTSKLDDVSYDNVRTLLFIANFKLVKVHNCIFHNFDHSAILVYDNYPIGNGFSIDINNNLFYNDAFHFGNIGIQFYRQVEYASVTNNRFLYLNYGIHVRDSANDRFENNHLSQNIKAIDITQTSTSYNSGKHLIIGNTCNHNSQGGIHILQSSQGDIMRQGGCTVSNNMCLINDLFGIKIEGGYGHIVTSNKVISNTNNDDGIILIDNTDGSLVNYSNVSNNVVMCSEYGATGKLYMPARNNVNSNNILVLNE